MQHADGGIKEGLSICDITAPQPYFDEWRQTAMEAYSVFDGEGLSPEMIKYAEEIGMPTRKINLSKSTIMTVVGHSEKLRTDVQVGARNNNFKDVAQASNELMHRDWSICKVNDTTRETFLDMMVAGIGFSYVGRDPRALRHKYKVEHVPWYEVKWDTYSMKGGFRSCRWITRRQAYHKDYLKLHLPKFKNIIDRMANGQSMGEYFDEYDDFDHEEHMSDLYDDERGMVVVHEGWERVPESRVLVEMDDGSLVEDSPELQGPRVKKNVEVIKKSIWLGPVKVIYNDHAGQNPPLIPMIGYTKTGSNIPVGPMHDMVDPAYNYNYATNQQLHILSTSKLLIKPGSLHESELEADENSAERIRIESLRQDGMISFKDEADIDSSIKILREWDELQVLQEMKRDYRQEMRDVSGIVAAFSGAIENDMAGVAIENAAELGSTNMAYLLSHRNDHEILLAEQLHTFHLNDIGDSEMPVEVKSPLNGQPRQIVLNQMGADGQISNRLSRSMLQITMSSIKSSAGYRQQVQSKYQDLIGQLPNAPEAQQIFIEAFLRNDDTPGMEDLLAKFLMTQGTPATPEEMAEQQQAQGEQQAQDRELAMADQIAETELKRAQANQANAVAESSGATARKQLAEAESEEETPTAELEKLKLELEIAKIRKELAQAQESQRNEKLSLVDSLTAAA